VGVNAGQMLKRHMRAPVGSRKPRRMRFPLLSRTCTSVLVKTTVQLASQTRPMLKRLFVNSFMRTQSVVPSGKVGSWSWAVPMDVSGVPLAMLTVVGGAL